MDSERLSADLLPLPLKCVNIIIDGRRTSLRMEINIWDALDEISRREELSVNELCSLVANNIGYSRNTRKIKAEMLARGEAMGARKVESSVKGQRAVTLTAAIRVFIMNYFRRLAQGKAPAHDGQSHLSTNAGSPSGGWSGLVGDSD
jgi:predicted DNA-binding ribbon-helix-helix protein